VIPYWVLFLFPAIAVVTYPIKRSMTQKYPVMLYAFIVTLMIGTRFDVGGDWQTYLEMFHMLQYSSRGLLTTGDAGYSALSWLMGELGIGIYGINLFCGAIFMAGLAAFSLRTPLPWVAVLVAVPYLIIVVAMGYTRQSAAIGFEFFALLALSQKKLWHFYAYVLLAALFHKTAVVLALLGLFSSSNRFSLVQIISGLLIVYFSLQAFLADYYEALMVNYVGAKMQSSGGLVRVLMNALPAVIILLYHRRWKHKFGLDFHWILFAAVAVLCLPLVMIASTAVDRMALYIVPLQLYVWAHLPILLRTPLFCHILIFYHAAILFVWLNSATHAQYWLPYQSIIFVDTF